MKIGIDARMIEGAGIGRYIKNLLLELQKIDNENSYFVFLLKKDFEKYPLNKNFEKVKADFKWYTFSEQIKFPNLLIKYKLSLMHFPHFNVPIFYSGKYIVTIHDLIHTQFKMQKASTHFPIAYQLKHLAYQKVLKTAVKKSQKIITVSDYSKQQIITKLKANPNKIVVTSEAVDPEIIGLFKKISQVEIKKALDKFNIKPPFLFYIGNAHPHKNIEGLIKAFLEIRKKYQYLQLVFAGKENFFWEKIKKEIDSRFRGNDIIFTGFVTDEELVALYKSAQIYIEPSFEEGFGIPILEAMACECPVVASNLGSLPEVGSDAVIYFDPHSISDMQEKIIEVLNDQKLRKELIEKGIKRYKDFSWEKLAKQTLDIYKNF